MHYSPANYYRLGTSYPRTRLREVYGRARHAAVEVAVLGLGTGAAVEEVAGTFYVAAQQEFVPGASRGQMYAFGPTEHDDFAPGAKAGAAR